MFEPVHGSAPDIAGQGRASPVGAILALALLLRHLDEAGAADQVEGAVRELVVSGRLPTLDACSGLSTSQVGEMVANQITRAAGSVSPAGVSRGDKRESHE
jgi:isocitrate/isopropylmalate dehydrogenase